MRQRLHKVMQAMLAIVLFCAMGFAHGQTQILLVLSDGSGASSEVAAAMQSYFATQNSAFDIRTINASAFSAARVNFTETDIIVAIGTHAMEQVAVDARVPVLNILVPRQSYESTRLRAKHDSRQYSAIYLDQPLTRQLQLIKAALPNRDAVGVLLGPSSQDRLKPLQQAAREQKVGVSAEQVTTEEDIIPALKRLFTNADVLLALPDPLVFNKIPHKFALTSYRADSADCVFQIYVSAGALAAVYSTPADRTTSGGAINALDASQDADAAIPAISQIFFSQRELSSGALARLDHRERSGVVGANQSGNGARIT